MHQHQVAFKARRSGIIPAQHVEMAPKSANGHAVHAVKVLPQPAPAPPAAPVNDSVLLAAEKQMAQNLLADWARLIQEFRGQIGQSVHEAAQMSVELGTAIAERLVGAEIAANRQRLERIVHSVLERMPAARQVVVRGHPDDLTLLKRLAAEQPDLEGYRDLLTFRADDSLQRGQLKLEADEWFMEWDTQRSLNELRAALLEETFMDE